jgi:acetylornithine deacetylase/succinyl-diaminopimelate desuccinylase-like protein
LDRLRDLIRIPSVSMAPEHAPDMARAADWLVELMRQIGLENVDLLPTGGVPVVYGEWLHAGPGAPTLLAYGHYDVQPVDPLEEWLTPPFEPARRGDDLFGRGASDDKGQLLAVLAAAEAWLQAAGHLPINLKVMLEGEEEISSPHMAAFVQDGAQRLACDAVLICDDAMLDPHTPLITYGVRGNVYLQLTVRGPAHDLHSGTFGGAVENPFNVLVRLLARCQDPDTRRITIPHFYDRVRPLSDEERALLARIPLTDTAVCAMTGAPALAGEAGYTTLERAAVRPTFEIHGVQGGFIGPGKKTVLPAWAGAKVSMRLVPDQDPQEIARLAESFLRSMAPPTVELECHVLGRSRPAVVDLEAPAVQAMLSALEMGFGIAPLALRGGGSLPIVAEFQDALGAPVVLAGFGLPDDNTHAPNEKLHLPSLYGGIETLIHYYHELAQTANL